MWINIVVSSKIVLNFVKDYFTNRSHWSHGFPGSPGVPGVPRVPQVSGVTGVPRLIQVPFNLFNSMQMFGRVPNSLVQSEPWGLTYLNRLMNKRLITSIEFHDLLETCVKLQFKPRKQTKTDRWYLFLWLGIQNSNVLCLKVTRLLLYFLKWRSAEMTKRTKFRFYSVKNWLDFLKIYFLLRILDYTVVGFSTSTAPLIPSGPRDWFDMSI